MQRITPCLWFYRNAEEAMAFYTSLFKGSEIKSIKRYPEGPLEGPMSGMQGKVLTAIFALEGFQFMALDGGPIFQFNPSVSFFVNCNTREEINQLWEELSEGGEALMPLDEYPFSPWYGWIQDQYGLSWQLILAAGAAETKIIPSLMFVGDQAGKAEEAIGFYARVFKDSRVGDIARYSADQSPDEAGTVAYARFTLQGQHFAAMDSARGHDFSFNEAVSLYVECQNQEEVDHYWDALSAVREAEQCGWLKDRYGLSWQIIPKQLGEMMSDPDPEKSGRVMDSMLKMKKIDIRALEEAYRGE
jgi:predicted 3-demethylubiquinone-9 3-methyltransferase (glyoxalase superfamily)